MAAYPLSFKELKSRVGVDDIAFALGYCIDKKAGVGKYMELVLGDSHNPTDKIIVRNTTDKSQQFYFRRDGSKGDVVSFIKENLNAFNVSGENDWIKILNVLAKYGNMPSVNPEVRDYVHSQLDSSKVFDSGRYKTATIDANKIPWFFHTRGISSDTVRRFGDNLVLIKDLNNKSYDGYNIGFPYINPTTMQLSGYEIRGNKGYKSKAAGTDSSHSAWIAEFPRDAPHNIRNVYFFESSVDALSFYQINRTKLMSMPFALVSVGGAFNPKLADDVMNRFPAAKAWDCFDNDLAGNIYSANLIKAVDKIELSVITSDDTIYLKHGDKEIQCPKEGFSFEKSSKTLGINYSCGHWKSPRNFKDWNDCLLNKMIEPKVSPSKYQRDENLAQKRRTTLKF
ncbi:MAG: DUF3991 and toprim domain-containing protein [Muribaculum sp.]|nr:DUF3991 and toprim domain-containing protein [Muribaculum sp.]